MTLEAPGRRVAILEAVWAVIAQTGIDGVSMRSVAREAGVSVGAIQHHFGTRAELVRESARAMLQGAEAAYNGQGPSVSVAVAHVIPRTSQQRVGATVWLAYVAASVGDADLADLLAEGKRGQEQEVARLLQAEDPALTASDAAARARALIGLADGLSVRVLIGDLSSDEALAALASLGRP